MVEDNTRCWAALGAGARGRAASEGAAGGGNSGRTVALSLPASLARESPAGVSMACRLEGGRFRGGVGVSSPPDGPLSEVRFELYV